MRGGHRGAWSFDLLGQKRLYPPYREQRGLLETSHGYKVRETEYNNSEVLAFREGLKFNYLVLPDGREPTEEELKIEKII